MDMTAESESTISVRFWGVRGSIPSPSPETMGYGGNTSCVEIRAGNQLVILDAGSGLRALGASIGSELAGHPMETTLLISHTHWDHIQGLPFFVPAYDGRNRIRILAPPGKRHHIASALENQMIPIHFPVRLGQLAGLLPIEEMSAANSIFGICSLRAINLNHPGDCAGFRFDCDGISIAYLSDHEPYHSLTLETPPLPAAEVAQARLTEFVQDCDLLILDTQYDEAEYPKRHGWGHGCVVDSVALAQAAGVRELALFHHDPSHGDAKIRQMLADAQRLANDGNSELKVRAAREGEQLKFSSDGAYPVSPPLTADLSSAR